MKPCPKCGQWSLAFDDYFGRFRCFGRNCGWMPPSSAEQEMRRCENSKRPEILATVSLTKTGIQVTLSYDDLSDALICSFGETGPTFDLPWPDGKTIWRIGASSCSVVGVAIYGAKEFGLNPEDRKTIASSLDISESLKACSWPLTPGRLSVGLMRKIWEHVDPKANSSIAPDPQMELAFDEAGRSLTAR